MLTLSGFAKNIDGAVECKIKESYGEMKERLEDKITIVDFARKARQEKWT